MHVIILNDYGSVNGGASQVAIASAKALAKAGLQVTFIAGVGPIDPTIPHHGIEAVDLGYHDLLGNPSRANAAITGLWNQRCAADVRKVLTKYGRTQTIIHLHSWVQALSSSVVRTIVESEFPIVCTLHDYFSVCPNGGFYNFPRQEKCTLAPMSPQCVTTNCDVRSYPQKLWRVARQAIQNGPGRIAHGIQNFITVSNYSERILARYLPSTSRFFRVRNPIRIDRLPPANVAENRQFAFVGRLSPEKGAVVFANAARLAGVTPVFVGAGTDQNKIAELCPKAVFLGWQQVPQVIRCLQSSRALVFPSVLHETQGMAVLEAAALGVPAIVSNDCAARDSIIEGETGLLFRTGDAVDLSRKIALLDENPEVAGNLGRQAYERYWQNPSSVDAHVRDTVACYEQILREAD